MGSYPMSSSFSAMSVTFLVPLSCLFALASSACTTTGGPASGSACVFPFKYADQTFYTCTNSGGFAPWCYTQVDSQGKGVSGRYGDCGTSPACSGATTTTTTTSTTTTSTTTTVDACVAACPATCSAPTTTTTTTTTITTTTTTRTYPPRIL